ncbi:hypothetical protein EA796_05100 [Pseudomonas sp. AOB-7]|uniref:hypothetical protein n=1 Tax=Pseudomonas sp. AOB-7 TaxID=2482750 RepID=UPI000EFCFAD0|nr:hypothetical protein [Pseudomonas sp. AOB-7]RMH85824.1 hypothetical protein EA796_05100 [Pseudomonas sp. AOB-7]
MADVRIDELERGGQRLWQVRVGRRALTFHEELAARAFAAQLHMRLGWLDQARNSDDKGSQPT